MYESYYGLNSKPFQLTPDPAFFFASKWHKRAMSYLQYGLSQAEGFIVITGDIGTGKTTIANSLLADMEDDIVTLDASSHKEVLMAEVTGIVCRFIENNSVPLKAPE